MKFYEENNEEKSYKLVSKWLNEYEKEFGINIVNDEDYEKWKDSISFMIQRILNISLKKSENIIENNDDFLKKSWLDNKSSEDVVKNIIEEYN